MVQSSPFITQSLFSQYSLNHNSDLAPLGVSLWVQTETSKTFSERYQEVLIFWLLMSNGACVHYWQMLLNLTFCMEISPNIWYSSTISSLREMSLIIIGLNMTWYSQKHVLHPNAKLQDTNHTGSLRADKTHYKATLTSWLWGVPNALQWRHNERDVVSNYQPQDCLLNHLSRCRSKKTSKPHVTGLCVGNSPVTGEFPTQWASNAENVSIWRRHHGNVCEKISFYNNGIKL